MKKVPILICIPYWEKDKTEAIEVCKIIAGLQTGHVGATAHVLLICRQDSTIDPNMVKIVSAKFNTFTYKSQSPLKGWPAGPNGMFGNAMIHIANNFKEKYECLYWLEPDAIPIRPNWFWDLVLEWRRKHPNAWIVGCRADCNGDGTGDHITGCAIYHPNIARLMPCLTTCSLVAWDYMHRAKIIQVAGHTKLIENYYKARNLPHTIVDRANHGVVIVHGAKDRSVINAVKSKYRIP